MKLSELIVHGSRRYGHSDVETSIDHRIQPPDVVVDTNIPGVTLEVSEFSYKFTVLIVNKGRYVGYVDFVRPDHTHNDVFSYNLKTWTPHSGIIKSHAGRGYVRSVYRWFLDAGHNLVTGHEQTEASNGLWRSLARFYPIVFFDGQTGEQIEHPTMAQAVHPDTRMGLLGKGSTSFDDMVGK